MATPEPSSAPPPSASSSTEDHGLPLSPRRLELVQDVLSLFQSKPSLSIFKRGWRDDAVFEDPIAIAEGKAKYMAQWFAMPKAFPQSETLEWKVVKNEDGVIQYEQKQKYTIAGIGSVKVIDSLVHIELDKEEYITRLEDRWNSKPLPNGALGTFFRGLNGKIVPKMVSVAKE